MVLEQLIKKIKTIPDCVVYPPNGLPDIEEKYQLPDDIKEFYHLCGGVCLYINGECTANIVPSNEFIPANPVIVGERCEDDITSNWYIIANDGNGDYLTIDLKEERLGRCYDSFWDRHGIVGECPIIANSFIELLEHLIDNKGQYWYWLRDDFETYGDAYDGIIE
jgi:hypothetical protein